MSIPIFISRKLKPCSDHWLVLKPTAKKFGGYCKRCGWKLIAGGWYLKPVKMFNRYFYDH